MRVDSCIMSIICLFRVTYQNTLRGKKKPLPLEAAIFKNHIFEEYTCIDTTSIT